MTVKKVSGDAIKPYDNTRVKLKTSGNTQEIQFMAGNNKTCSVKNLSKDTYLDKRTGEIKQKKKSESRYQSPKSVRKSINRLMDVIRCNVTDTAKCKWITVTYREIMTDGKKAFLDTKLFLRKLKRFLAKQSHISSGQKSFQYIAVAKPQGVKHGHSWHMHILLIFEDTAPYLANETISKLWGYGVTDTHAVYDGDGLALYFKAYLSDVEYEESDTDEREDRDSEHKPATVEKMVSGVSKQFISGERK